MREFLDIKLFELGQYTLRLSNVISLSIFISIVILVFFIVKRIIYKSKRIDSAKKFSITKLFQYILTIIAFVSSLHLLGFNVSVLLAGSAAVLVGLGFGLQSLFGDFISGVILLLEGTLKVDDIIEVNGEIYRVQEINFRTTTAAGRNDNAVIIPNSELTGNKIINWTHNKLNARFKVEIGVDYSTDVKKLTDVLLEVAKANNHVLKMPEPFVRFESFGDSSLNFSIFFYSTEIYMIETVKSQIRFSIHEALTQNGINIPFPQVVVHQGK